jgi:hypothetical protein
MAYFGMSCRVARVRPDVSDELSASFIRVTRISELGTTLVVGSNRRRLRRNTKRERKLVWNSELRMPKHTCADYTRIILTKELRGAGTEMNSFRMSLNGGLW